MSFRITPIGLAGQWGLFLCIDRSSDLVPKYNPAEGDLRDVIFTCRVWEPLKSGAEAPLFFENKSYLFLDYWWLLTHLSWSEVPPTRFCTPCYRASEGRPLHSVSHKNCSQIESSCTENKASSLSLILDC